MIEALEIDRLVLLGDSIGGAAAVRYAAELPACVDGLILSNSGGFDRGGFLAGIWRSFRTAEADQRALAARLTMPVLVAWASEDRIIRGSRSRAAIEAIPNGRVVMFQAGHSPFLGTALAFAAEARVFLCGLRRACCYTRGN